MAYIRVKRAHTGNKHYGRCSNMRCPTCNVEMARVVSDIDEYYECRNPGCPDCWETHDVRELDEAKENG